MSAPHEIRSGKGEAGEAGDDDDEFAKELKTNPFITADKLVSKHNLPNLYRTVKADGTGFDNKNLKLEQKFTIIAGVVIALGLLFSAVFYSQTTSSYTYELKSPSVEEYHTVFEVYAGKLIGKVECGCTQTILPFGTDSGGFVNNATFALDGICDGYNLTSPSTPNADLVQIHKNASKKDDWSWGCKSLPPTGSLPLECGVVNAVVEGIHRDLNDLCTTANKFNDKVVKAWLLESFSSDAMLQDSSFLKFMKANLDKLAVDTGLRMYVAHHGAKAVTADSTAPLKQMRSGQSLNVKEYSIPCDNFAFGSSDKDNQFKSALFECSGKATFTARCCGKQKGSACNAPVQLPCGKRMGDLGNRMKNSEYGSILEAIEGAFLKGMASDVRAARREKGGLLPPKPASKGGGLSV